MMAAGFSTYKNQVALQPGQKLGFRTGSGYYARPGGAAAPANAGAPDWLAPLNDAQLQTQARGMINAETNPLLDRIKQMYADRSRSGTDAIAGLSSRLADALSSYAPAAKAAYGEAQQGQAQVNAANASELHGGSDRLSADLANRLSYDPALASRVSGQASQTGQGAAAAGYATGSAELSKLLAEGAHATDYAAKQPGIAAAQGLTTGRDLQAQLNRDFTTQTGDIASKVPGATATLLNDLRGRELQKQIARQSGLLNNKKADAASAAADAKAAAAATKASQPDAGLSGHYGYPVDSSGHPVGGQVTPFPGYHTDPKTGRVVKDTKTAAAGKPKYTPQQTQAYQSKAYSIIQDSAHGYHVTEKDPTTKLPVDVFKAGVPIQAAIDRLKRAGVPESVYLPQLRKVYGELRARKAPPTAAQQSATQASLHPVDSLLGGR